MVIKGSAAKHDGERLHPAADVEQQGRRKKEKQRWRGEDRVCGGKDRKKKDNRERAMGEIGD